MTEKLTGPEMFYLRGSGLPGALKALRVIDALTELLAREMLRREAAISQVEDLTERLAAAEQINSDLSKLLAAKERAVELTEARCAELEAARAGIAADHLKMHTELAQLREALDFERDCLAACQRNGVTVSAQLAQLRERLWGAVCPYESCPTAAGAGLVADIRRILNGHSL